MLGSTVAIAPLKAGRLPSEPEQLPTLKMMVFALFQRTLTERDRSCVIENSGLAEVAFVGA